jgi:hypothetical protein
LAQCLGEVLRQKARGGVGTAAGRQRHDDLDVQPIFKNDFLKREMLARSNTAFDFEQLFHCKEFTGVALSTEAPS